MNSFATQKFTEILEFLRKRKLLLALILKELKSLTN